MNQTQDFLKTLKNRFTVVHDCQDDFEAEFCSRSVVLGSLIANGCYDEDITKRCLTHASTYYVHILLSHGTPLQRATRLVHCILDEIRDFNNILRKEVDRHDT